MSNAAASQAVSQASRLNSILEAAHLVHVPPTKEQLGDFMELLMQHKPALAQGVFGVSLPALVPSRSQREALELLVGPLPKIGAAVPMAGTGWMPDPVSFARQTTPLRFANFNRLLIVLQLIIRVCNPRFIAQRRHPLCGPVVLVESIARQYPTEYVEYVCGLAARGKARLRVGGGVAGMRIKLGNSNILRERADHIRIPQADYVALASLRDQGHYLIYMPYKSWRTSRVLEGWTEPIALCRWMREAGYRNVENAATTRAWGLVTMLRSTSSVVRDEFAEWKMRESLEDAKAKLATGAVFMSVAANLAHFAEGKADRDEPWQTLFGGHWVTLLGVNFLDRIDDGAGNIVRGGVEFHIRTWERETDANNLHTVPWSKVGNWYRGFVYGVP